MVKTAIPVFLGLILVEWLVGGSKIYRLNDSIADLGSGIGQQIFAVPLALFFVFIYRGLYTATALIHWSAHSVWTWITAFLLVDCLYYWFHRSSHRISFIWAAHIVHHQSEELNLAVALRQSWLQGLFSMVFYFPLAILGFPLEVTVTAMALNTIGQFWFHTRMIGKLGPLEWVLNTPSHHRVHHGRNPNYLDKNYAGVLIIWDRLFGTFTSEEEAPVYGIVKPLNSWNVVWANTHYWIELARLSAEATNWKQKILVWFLPPDKLAGPAPDVSAATVKKYDARGTRSGQIYGAFTFLTALIGLFLFLAPFPWWNTTRHFAAACFLIWTLTCSGAFLEDKSWAKWAETARLTALLAALVAAQF